MHSGSAMRRSFFRPIAASLFAALFALGSGPALAAIHVTVDKTPDGDVVAAGTLATFTITINNDGTEETGFLKVIDLLPGIGQITWTAAAVAPTLDSDIGCSIFTGSDWSPNPAQQVLDCDLNSIPVGEARTLAVSGLTPENACLELNNVVRVYYDDLVEPADAATSPYESADGSITVTSNLCRPLFVIGDVEPHAVGDVVNFWGAQWWKNNIMSGFVSSGVASFKGYASDSDNFCGPGATWETRPGNSSKPPATIPPDVMVIVTDTVHKDGPDITGTITQILLVESDGGYGPNPGHRGNGTVREVLCPVQQP